MLGAEDVFPSIQYRMKLRFRLGIFALELQRSGYAASANQRFRMAGTENALPDREHRTMLRFRLGIFGLGQKLNSQTVPAR